MNKRIKELAGQVEKYISTTNFEGTPEDEMTYDEIFQKKFAELIVQDCVQQIKTQGAGIASDDYEKGFNAGLFHSLHTIKEHFGVK